MSVPRSDASRRNTDYPERSRRAGGFTLVELLVAMVILSLLVVVLFSMVDRAGSILQRSRNGIDSYQSSRFAFNLVTRTLAQSRINAYQDYDNPASPTTYLRKSDLHFVIDDPVYNDFGQGNSVFFQAPLGRSANTNYSGVPGLLNAVGYYVTYGKDPNLPSFLRPYDRNRFRLMQFLPPTEKMVVYTTTDKSWFKNYLPDPSNPDDPNAANVSVVANNVILFLCWPRLSKEEDATGSSLVQTAGGKYRYDSRAGATQVPLPVTANQQPPTVQVTLVVVDETRADRLPDTTTPPTEITGQLNGLFQKATEDDYHNDLAVLESRLSAARIGYRVFNSTVPLLEAKWTK